MIAQMVLMRNIVLAASILMMAAAQSTTAATAPGATAMTRRLTHVIDDSATVILDGPLKMAWRSTIPGTDNVIVGKTRIDLKLATTPWVGKSGKIFITLPAETIGSVKVSWRAQGVLRDGQLTAGLRTLLFVGQIRERIMEDILDMQIEADGTQIRQAQQLRFQFEMDID